MAPYLLQWHAMSFAKEKGSALYDLLWVNNPNDPHDPLVWVSQFKEKFGGRVIRFPEKRIFFYGISWKILFLIKNWKEKFFH
jgi:lipid II:glycine glycyltransferase (peptidoglycan interpeptide bridge formation enzyme)